ncbi:MAG: ParA family protein [Bacteroidota bacterium]
MSKIISIYNFKGGVGKTTSTVNLAYSWARNFKVLVIDCDPQINLTQSLTESTSSPTLYDAMRTVLHNQEVPTDFEKITSYLHLLRGDYRMVDMESNNQFITFGPSLVERLMRKVKEEYDLIILDLPSYFGKVVQSFVINSDALVIPAIPDNFSMAGVQKLLNYLSNIERNYPLSVLGIFFNQMRLNTLHHRKMIAEAKQGLGDLVVNQFVRESIRISEAHEVGRSLYSGDTTSPVAQDFLKLSDELLSRLNRNYARELVENGAVLESA